MVMNGRVEIARKPGSAAATGVGSPPGPHRGRSPPYASIRPHNRRQKLLTDRTQSATRNLPKLTGKMPGLCRTVPQLTQATSDLQQAHCCLPDLSRTSPEKNGRTGTPPLRYFLQKHNMHFHRHVRWARWWMWTMERRGTGRLLRRRRQRLCFFRLQKCCAKVKKETGEKAMKIRGCLMVG
ncbi:unnamed protein product [Victoria cruziana]